MIGGRIKCDFCEFIGEMQFSQTSKGALKVPDSWVSIHPHVTIHGIKSTIEKADNSWKTRKAMKDKIAERVKSLHVCPGCVSGRNVFDLQESLPAPIRQKTV